MNPADLSVSLIYLLHSVKKEKSGRHDGWWSPIASRVSVLDVVESRFST